ncbi:hypothetical protein T484DRAFT_1797772 [Baffinella frigidus]|nr:hypothetical protein T484DRAFT_1797772 [Cryptophyta sp. CCMP2293]
MVRVDLHGISGMRFWMTLLLVCRRSFAFLIPVMGSGGPACSLLNFASHDLVSAYFILAGFVMQWGYHGRSMEGAEAFWRFLSRRLSRFYPDFLISSLLAYVFSLPFVFGCTFKLASLWWNALALSLLHVWVRVWTPEMMPANGPAWFIVTLVWS